MDNKQFLLDTFNDDFCHTIWLLNKDQIYATEYFKLLADIQQDNEVSNYELECLIDRFSVLGRLYDERYRDSSTWVTPKKQAANELVHNEDGNLTQESVELLQTAISDKNGEKTLVSDTGKTISFDEKWHTMLQDCGFKSLAVEKLTDFISKLIEVDGWSKYFVGNIGKNNKRQIQEYHAMDEYNLKHGTRYAAMHLGGNTTRCVLVEVETSTSDGRGEPSSITFLEIGAHTIIDRFIVGSFKINSGMPITEAGPDELAKLFEVN